MLACCMYCFLHRASGSETLKNRNRAAVVSAPTRQLLGISGRGLLQHVPSSSCPSSWIVFSWICSSTAELTCFSTSAILDQFFFDLSPTHCMHRHSILRPLVSSRSQTKIFSLGTGQLHVIGLILADSTNSEKQKSKTCVLESRFSKQG